MWALGFLESFLLIFTIIQLSCIPLFTCTIFSRQLSHTKSKSSDQLVSTAGKHAFDENVAKVISQVKAWFSTCRRVVQKFLRSPVLVFFTQKRGDTTRASTTVDRLRLKQWKVEKKEKRWNVAVAHSTELGEDTQQKRSAIIWSKITHRAPSCGEKRKKANPPLPLSHLSVQTYGNCYDLNFCSSHSFYVTAAVFEEKVPSFSKEHTVYVDQ